MATGEELRNEGMRQALENAEEEWKAYFRAVALHLADCDQLFTTEDVLAVVGEPPKGTHPNTVGALMGSLSRAGKVRPIGFVNSRKPRSHAHAIRQWEGVQRGA